MKPTTIPKWWLWCRMCQGESTVLTSATVPTPLVITLYTWQNVAGHPVCMLTRMLTRKQEAPRTKLDCIYVVVPPVGNLADAFMQTDVQL